MTDSGIKPEKYRKPQPVKIVVPQEIRKEIS